MYVFVMSGFEAEVDLAMDSARAVKISEVADAASAPVWNVSSQHSPEVLLALST